MDGSNLISIAVGAGADSRFWKNRKMLWGDMVEKLKVDHKTNETSKEYHSLPKEDKTKIKDVGGYVGGYLSKGRRKSESLLYRQLVTLDLDFANDKVWDIITMLYENEIILHSTHSHTLEDHRYRLILPLSREVTPDEYLAISRRLAGDIGIELFDSTTFQVHRLMFWPSTPKDVEYVFKYQQGPWVDADKVLNSYEDWTDSTQWPISSKEKNKVLSSAKKQEDPELKQGLIGAFCKAYSIHEAISAYLSDIYEPTTTDRYTYKHGSSASGLVIYEDKFAYSHHGTDPCSGLLCNAFDLVRIHKFRHEDTERSSNKSMSLMMDLARKDDKIKILIAEENLQNTKYDFYEGIEIEPDGLKWVVELEIDAKGNFLSTANNLNIIFANDKKLQGVFKRNTFNSKQYIMSNVPWRKITSPEPVRNVDESGIRNYIESIYGISSKLKIDDSITLEFEKNSFHPIKDYLNGLTWDKTNRIDSLLVDYFGSKNTLYTREAIRKTLTAAVARVFAPGIKFDLVLTLIGAQGTGKSTFVKRLGKDWFSDTFTTVKGKEALEQIQGAWIMEIAELSALRKAEIEAVKHFISKQEDIFRPAYGRITEVYPRQTVFIGTTNKKDFLTDPSGNRRFMPVDVVPEKATKDVFNIPEREIDQIWAEAVELFKSGERIYLSKEADIFANEERREHSETDERLGLIEKFVNRKLPPEWEDMNVYERRDYMDDDLSKRGTVQREYFCVAEIWCECLRKEKEDMDRYRTRDINDILKSLEGWGLSNSARNFKMYGKQRYYERHKKT